MKNYLTALSATALIGLAPHTLAASSTDLTVTGTLTPSACTLILSNGGSVDYGKVPVKDLNPDSTTNLPIQTFQMSIKCDDLKPFKLTAIDNQPGSSTSEFTYGLGYINGDQKLGGFYLRMANVVADGKQVYPLFSIDGGTVWHYTQWMDPTKRLLSVGPSSTPFTPIPVKDVTMDLTIWSNIAPTSGLDLTAQASIAGSLTLEIDYL